MPCDNHNAHMTAYACVSGNSVCCKLRNLNSPRATVAWLYNMGAATCDAGLSEKVWTRGAGDAVIKPCLWGDPTA